MIVLIDCSNYFVRWFNLGDVALYQAAAKRLSEIFSGAELHILTAAPDRIREHCSALRPLSSDAVHARDWFAPGGTSRWPVDGAWPLRRTAIAMARRIDRRLLPPRLRAFVDAPQLEAYFQTLWQSDLVLLSGGGYFTDAFADHARGLLDTLAGAQALGRPTAIMSPGFEHMTGAAAEKARAVLPNVRLIGCRDDTTSPEILKAFGVPRDRVVATGDDSIEIAIAGRMQERNAIGFGLRVHAYANVDGARAKAVGAAVADVAGGAGASVIPLPINLVGPSDSASIRQALDGLDVDVDSRPDPATTAALLERVGRCRIVVTGAYHAAVFAMAMGIPVVALAASDHYRRKFGGLASIFRNGCRVVDLAAAAPAEQIRAAALEAWDNADGLHAPMRTRAYELLGIQRAFWRRLRELV